MGALDAALRAINSEQSRSKRRIQGVAVLQYVAPIVIAAVFIALVSFIAEPARQRLMAVMIGGAGAAYLSAFGMGYWEFGFTATVTYCAYRGLTSYGFIGVGWLLHTGWDILHHVTGSPLLPFSATSSLGCAVCDPVIALWCFVGAPSLSEFLRGTTR
jgi:hypothetical protein